MRSSSVECVKDGDGSNVIAGCTTARRARVLGMKRAHVLALIMLVSLLSAGVSGCARQASNQGMKRLAEPNLTDPGSSGLSRDSKAYMANDPL